MGLSVGDLDRKITLLRFGVTYDANNQPTEGWSDIGTVWASWRRATANERLAAAQIAAQVTDIFEIHWSPTVADLNPKDRLTYQGRIYDLAEVTEIGRRDGILIRASARVDTAP